MPKKIKGEIKGEPLWEKKERKNNFYSFLIVGIAFFICSIIMFLFKLHPFGFNERFGQFSVSSPYLFLGFSLVLLVGSYFLYKKTKNNN